MKEDLLKKGYLQLHIVNSAGNLTNRKMGKLGLPSDPGLNGWQETFAEIRFFEDMPEGVRKDATYFADLPVADNGAIDVE